MATPGEVSADLSRAGVRWWTLRHAASMEVWRAARESIGLCAWPPPPTEGDAFAPDIASEAIELAEAHGL